MRRLLAGCLAISFCLIPLARLHAQLDPPTTGGVAGLSARLRPLGHVERVLMIGAHPDDEDTELLTILVRGMGAEAAYLSLNRGEGGQNLIGPELGEALGLLRSEELLAARRLDGARQFFTRAYDFGFSKTIDDTWAHWPQDSILKDVVRIVRQFQPQVIVSVFSGTPRDGHGHHQAAGWAAMEAFRVAGDSSRFPELLTEERLPPWTPLKLYRSTRFDTAATTLTLDGGMLDEAIGQSFHQIAMRGRSLHRSQDMGQLQGIGPSRVRLQLLQDRSGRGAGGLWAGVDTSVNVLGPWRAAPGESAADYLRLIDSARATLGASSVSRTYALLRRARTTLWSTDAAGRAAALDQRRGLDQALASAGGVLFDAYTSDERVVPGQELTLTLSAWNTTTDTVTVEMTPSGWAGWVFSGSMGQLAVPPGAVGTTAVRAVVPDQVRGADSHLQRDSVLVDLYHWPRGTGAYPGKPFPPPALEAEFRRMDSAGVANFITREVVARWNDQARGEVRRPVIIVPRVDVKLEPDNELWRAGARGAERFTVALTHGARDTTTGQVTIEVPVGWPRVTPQRFRLTREDERQSFSFDLRPPPLQTGSFQLRAVATDSAGQRYDLGVFMVDYPHIRPRSYTRNSTATVRMAPLVLPPLAHVGYIRGGADRVPEALMGVGVPLELIDGAALERGDLSRFDAIVVGPRAYETDAELPTNNARLLDYARQGGLVIVQYQQYEFFQQNYAPYPLTVASRPPGTEVRLVTSGTRPGMPVPAGSSALLGGHDRVTDETAPVTIVDPSSPVVRTPNRLQPEDWSGWIQERGLYFAHSWDPTYRTVLEMHDLGEGPLEGGLLIAPVGRGTYVYTGLSFFRQLPAAVPGAFRLFANLLALNPKLRKQ